MCRTPIPVDWKRVDELLEAGCTGVEIAAYFAMHPNTFYDKVAFKYKITFTEYLQQKRSRGDCFLREAQYLKAIKNKDNSILIWLGKQRLGQKDNHDEKNIAEATIQNFTAIMQQLHGLQDAQKSSTSSEIKEDKSECVTGEERAEGGKESIF